jgi:hypothetical protein
MCSHTTRKLWDCSLSDGKFNLLIEESVRESHEVIFQQLTSDSVVSGDLQEGNQVCVILEGKTLSAQESAIIPWWSGWHSIQLYNFRKP